MTAAEYAALDEAKSGYRELLEGRLLMAPSRRPSTAEPGWPWPCSCWPNCRLDLEVLQDVDVDLQLTAADQPEFVRRPDLVLVRRSGSSQVDADGGLLVATDAGIPHYWIVDLDNPITLTACHLAEDFGYQDPGAVTGTFTTTTPSPPGSTSTS